MVFKIIEKVVADRLNHYLAVNILGEPYQSAYKKGGETPLLCVQNDIVVLWIIVNVLYLLDLSAAFDTVEHNILLQRIMSNKFGIKRKALDWFISYLTERSRL